MKATGKAIFEFTYSSTCDDTRKSPRQGLSAVAAHGDTLWIANDESLTIERLTRQESSSGELHFGAHQQFALNDLLTLPAPPSDSGKFEEADIEGLDVSGNYLWVVGSHSLKRARFRASDSPVQAAKRLARVRSEANRFLLARIPFVDSDEGPVLRRKIKHNGETLTAAILRGDELGNELSGALVEDIHLRPFLRIPGKDNGFDIEGLAVAGERILLGLRGPVLRGWATILEVMPIEVGNDPFALKLMKFVPDKQPYLKHFLQLDGLGIRDLCVRGEDLLILAGPTMTLEGPVRLFRWPGGAIAPRETIVPRDELELLGTVPTGEGVDAGRDHPEGLTLLTDAEGGPSSALVVYDQMSTRRQLMDRNAVTSDVFLVP